MRNAESVKARLKNIAKETGRTMQDIKRWYFSICTYGWSICKGNYRY